MDDFEPHLPPCDLDAEAAVLSACVLDREALPKVQPIVAPESFYSEAHRRIYEACLWLAENERQIDIVQVSTRIRDTGRLAQAGGMTYLTQVINAAPAVTNVVAYAETVARKARVRKMQALARRIAAESDCPIADEDEWTDECERAVHEIVASRIDNAPLRTMRSVVRSVFTKLMEASRRAAEGVYELPGVPTGFTVIDDSIGGLRNGESYVLAGRPGMGKCQPLGAKVLTPSGWRTMGELTVGDLVLGADGAPARITNIYEPGEKRIYRLVMDDGALAESCEDHLWLTRTRGDRQTGRDGSPKSLRDIRATLHRPGGGAMHSVKRMGAAQFVRGLPLPVHPYLLGLYLGDGWCGRAARFSNPEADIQQRLAELLVDDAVVYEANGKDMRIRSRAEPRTVVFKTQLQRLGLGHLRSWEKFIPPQYLYASVDDRVALLQGICDSDGYVTTPSRTAVEVSTASSRLAEDIQFLVGALGGASSVRRRETHYVLNGDRHEARDAYRIVLSFPEGNVTPVSSAKHLRKWKGGKLRAGERFIVDVEDTGRVEPVRCIQLDSADHLYVTDGFIVTHNTGLIMNVADHVAHAGYGVIVFSLEMPDEQLATRALCSSARVDGRKARVNKFDMTDWSKLQVAAQHVTAPEHFYLVDRPSSLLDMRSFVRARASEMARDGVKIGLVAVDYLQLMAGRDGSRSREEAVSENARGLKLLAKELSCPVVALSQLNRGVESRNDKRPMLSDLRESGAIEEAADGVIGMYRDDYYHEHSKTPGVVELIFLKNRHGPTGTVVIGFEAKSTTFMNVREDEYGGEERYP